MTTRKGAVICIAHGGGPMPALGDPSHASIIKSLKTTVPKILKLNTPEEPSAIIVVTAHWNTDEVRISSAEKPEIYYDYSGFPPESYTFKYDAPGSSQVANMIKAAMDKEGVKSVKDEKRGWDHGVFIPMLLINPKAHIPIIQLSILRSESPSAHYALGRALSSLRDQNIAIVGSGFVSMHNLRALFSGANRMPAFQSLNKQWSNAVNDAVQTSNIQERGKKFEGWRSWPGSYEMHPRGGADHFLPLVVCAGAVGEEKAKAFAAEYMGLDIWSYYWE